MSAGEQRQAEELNSYLDALQAGELPPAPPDLPAEQAALLCELDSVSHTIQPDPRFRQALERRLLAAAEAQIAPVRPAGWIAAIWAWLHTIDRRLALSLAGALAVVALFFAALVAQGIHVPLFRDGTQMALATQTMAWGTWATATRHVETQIALIATATATEPPTATPGLTPAENPTMTPLLATATPDTAPTPTSVPADLSPTPTMAVAGGSGETPLLPPLAASMCRDRGIGCDGQLTQVAWTLGAALPEGPAQAAAWTLNEPGALTAATVNEQAARLGIQGGIYVPTEMAHAAAVPGLDLVAVDGPRQVTWENSTTLVYRDQSLTPVTLLAADQAVSAAEAFLRAHGLLDVPYQVAYAGGTVSFYRLLDGIWPVHGPLARVELGPAGQVATVYYRDLDLQQSGAYPLIAAAEAWQRLQNGQLENRTWYQVERRQAGPRTWQRIYPSGEQADLFGTPQVLLARDGGPPHVTLHGLVLQGSVGALVEQHLAVQGRAEGDVPLHVWGQVQDAGSYQVLIVAGWQDASAQPYHWLGTLRGVAEGGELVTEEGRNLPLPDLPADWVDGMPVSVLGGLVDGRLEWSLIQEQVPVVSPTWCAESCAATVEAVALVYLLPSPDALSGEQRAAAGFRALQPAWWFSALTDQGDRISAYVQAVPDAYVDAALGPVPNQP